jgi:hypothetical protein
VPEIRPFRALRYEPDSVGDPASVVAPPYDAIGAAEHQRLLDRSPRNIVRLDLPTDQPGDEPGDRYRRAARTLAAWRGDGTFRKDPRPAIYVYEQTSRVPGTDVIRTQRGFFARLRLEPLGPGGGVLASRRTLAAPREDRYMLLRATGVNTSPITGLYEDPDRRAAALLDQLVTLPVTTDVMADDGVRHRLWVVPASDDAGGPGAAVRSLIAIAAAGPTLIADGHHRYEAALRYRDERRMTRSCEEDPPFDYILTLFLALSEPLAVLPAHCMVRGLAEDGAALLRRAGELFGVTPANRATLLEEFDVAAHGPGGPGRFGLWTRHGGAILTAPGAAAAADQPLDAGIVAGALAQLAGIDADAVAAGRLSYTGSAAEAIAAVDAATNGADAAFLLEPTPVATIARIVGAGPCCRRSPPACTRTFSPACS